ncbi:MAG: type VI secretion system lipoprotein TssJ [Planctomycetes bacterium]|nr:type VI secretion system lipoprotein TssJ [Planctomycetota bacterium]
MKTVSVKFQLCIAIVAALLLLSGCGTVTVQARGVSPLNLNEHGESTPVDVRFYQLRSDQRFRTASFDQLWMSETDALGPDKLGDRVVATIFPGTPADRPAEVRLGKRQSGTAFIGVLALYRRSETKDARTVVIPIDQASTRVLQFTGYSVAITEDGRSTESTDTEQPQPRNQR